MFNPKGPRLAGRFRRMLLKRVLTPPPGGHRIVSNRLRNRFDGNRDGTARRTTD